MISFSNKGISALPMVLVISMVIIEVSVISVILANTFNNTRVGQRLAAEAYYAARSGANDGILRVLRYQDSPSVPECPDSYELMVGSRVANVCMSTEGDNVIVESTGSAFFSSKKVEATIEIDPDSSEISIVSFKEVPL
jgi:hypothetical protein